MRLSFYLTSLAFVLTATACTPKLSGLQISEAFTAQNVLNDRMIIGGVVSGETNLPPAKISSYSNMLRSAFMDERKEYATLPYGSFVGSLEADETKRVLDEYQKTGSLSDKTMKMLADKIDRARFFVMARIIRDQVKTGQSEKEGYYEKDSDGNLKWRNPQVNSWSEREALVSIDIFDLQRRNLAFSGMIEESKKKDKTYTLSTLGAIRSIVSAARGSDPYPAPPAPAIETILPNVFWAFAANLPELED
ncbi:MAG: hypothetical protein ACO3LE_09240 [Bdellovibrionota bacterium]